MFCIRNRASQFVGFKNQGVLVQATLGHFTSIGTPKEYATCKDKDCCKNPVQAEGKKVEVWPKPDKSPSDWYGSCPKEPQPVNYDPYRIKIPDVAVPPLPPATAKPMLDCTKPMSPCSGKLVQDPPPCPPPPPPPFPWIYVVAPLAFFSTFGIIYKAYLYYEKTQENKIHEDPFRQRKIVKRPIYEKDIPACVQYLIVGTGAAGWSAYKAINEFDKTAKVLFITREDIIPYIRPPMSKFMWWNHDPPDLSSLTYAEEGHLKTMFVTQCKAFMDPVKFYRKKKGPAVALASGWCVSKVDADHHVVYVKTNCGDMPVFYERCLLALGSKPKNLRIFEYAPKSVRDKVCTLRTIRDLETAYVRVKAAKHVTIIGGGFLGTELAWHLGKMNTVVERHEDDPPIEFVHVIKDKGILGGLIPEYLGEWAVEKVKGAGVTVMPKTQVYDAFTNADGQLELTLSNGSSMKTDYVFVCVGTDAQTDIALKSELETDKVNGGFLVNTELKARTHLYVAGDAASFYSTRKDTRLRCEHFMNAVEQGYVAGANMTGMWFESTMEPKFRLRLGEDLEVEGIGEVGACLSTIALFKRCTDDDPPPKEFSKKTDSGSGDKPCYKKSSEYKSRYKRGILFYIRDEIVVGMVFWNVPPIENRFEVATEMIRARIPYKDINLMADQLGFPETQCTYVKPEDFEEAPVCIKTYKYAEME